MKRFHAFEWEDLKWFPVSWRDYGTDYLKFIATRFDIYKPVIPLLKKGIDQSKEKVWVDCASGAGSGLLNLAKHFKKEYPDLKIVLTDFYPNIEAFERTKSEAPDTFEYVSKSVDATNVPKEFDGNLRTLFGAFHHFRPDSAGKILQNAVDSDSPIIIIEPVGRNFMSFFSLIFIPLNVILFTPFIRPVRWSVLPFIYLIPLIPLYILWDGTISLFRTYNIKERKALIASLKNSEKFHWEIDQTKGAMPINFIVGYKKSQNESAG